MSLLRDFGAREAQAYTPPPPPARDARVMRRCENCGAMHVLQTGRERTCDDCAKAKGDEWAGAGRGE